MTDSIKKLIADNQWRDIAEATEEDCVFLYKSENGKLGRGKVEYQVLVPSDYYDVEPTRCVLAIDEEYRPSAEATHFRPLPDDRLAKVCEALVETLVEIENIKSPTSLLASIGLEEVEKIAKGEM
jgi:hypothetical protein